VTVYYGGKVADEVASGAAPLSREALVAELTALVTAELKAKPLDPDNIDGDIARFCAVLKPVLEAEGLPDVADIDLGTTAQPRRGQ